MEAAPELEMMAPAPLNIACFRYSLDSPESADELNTEIVIRLQEEGIAAPSLTDLGGRTVIRVANVNHRSRHDDFELLVREVIRLGDEIRNSS